jgi:hypothetical protein
MKNLQNFAGPQNGLRLNATERTLAIITVRTKRGSIMNSTTPTHEVKAMIKQMSDSAAFCTDKQTAKRCYDATIMLIKLLSEREWNYDMDTAPVSVELEGVVEGNLEIIHYDYLKCRPQRRKAAFADESTDWLECPTHTQDTHS